MDFEKEAPSSPIEQAAYIVAAYISNNRVAAGDLPTLISSVFESLTGLAAADQKPAEPEPLVPAVSIKKSVTDDYIICLEDGKKFKSMKRHLGNHYGMTPDEYRTKWKLSADYPMVAPNYAAARSALAKTMGLGRKAAVPAPDVAPAAKAAKPRAQRKMKEAAE